VGRRTTWPLNFTISYWLQKVAVAGVAPHESRAQVTSPPPSSTTALVLALPFAGDTRILGRALRAGFGAATVGAGTGVSSNMSKPPTEEREEEGVAAASLGVGVCCWTALDTRDGLITRRDATPDLGLLEPPMAPLFDYSSTNVIVRTIFAHELHVQSRSEPKWLRMMVVVVKIIVMVNDCE